MIKAFLPHLPAYIKKFVRINFLNFFKSLIFVFMILLIIFFMNISYKDIVFLSSILIVLFSLTSLILYTFKENKEDRKLLINIWRMYAPSIIILHSILFSIGNFINNQEIDFIKTELNYNIQLKKDENNQNINDIYNIYKEKMEKQKKIFDKKYIIEIKNFKEYVRMITTNEYDSNNIKPNSNNDNYILWWANPILLITNLLTLFMFMRLATEVNFRKRTNNYSSNFDSTIYKYY
ncbi:hypothetical protein L5F46_05805 [Aliarcobacter butzleri]|uniref:hypothetical protein n=1 Tax=Aliarcobacter butzleri TaxID=28197 RepID=UPI001EDE83DB|nr:hypothetical protein [Aliarcobacter butzleri]MCG3674289.1 hypothetical protein [Aliarcobacter butzleri]